MPTRITRTPIGNLGGVTPLHGSTSTLRPTPLIQALCWCAACLAAYPISFLPPRPSHAFVAACFVDMRHCVPSVYAFLQVTLPPGKNSITAIKYGHQSPKGSPQSGEDKICCGNRDFTTHPCKPASCPISSGKGADYLPAMPFHAAIVGGKCKCFAPQVCDE